MKVGELVEDLIQLKAVYGICYPDDNFINLACNIIENLPDQQMSVSEWIENNRRGGKKRMRETLLSKEEFVDCIDRLREANDLQNKISELMRESRDNIENDFMNSAALQINHESTVIKLLIMLMHDDETYSDIEYFIYELDYGRNYVPGMIKDDDENEIDFSTAGKLYDYLEKSYTNDR